MPKKSTEITTRTTTVVSMAEIKAVLCEAYGERFSLVEFDIEMLDEDDEFARIDFRGARIITEKTEKS